MAQHFWHLPSLEYIKSVVGIEERLNIAMISESSYLACLASSIWYKIFSSMEFQMQFGTNILGSDKRESHETSDLTGQTKLPKEIVGAVVSEGFTAGKPAGKDSGIALSKASLRFRPENFSLKKPNLASSLDADESFWALIHRACKLELIAMGRTTEFACKTSSSTHEWFIVEDLKR